MPIDTQTNIERDSDAPAEEQTTQQPLIEEELLVEEVSIDGMCGVY